MGAGAVPEVGETALAQCLKWMSGAGAVPVVGEWTLLTFVRLES